MNKKKFLTEEYPKLIAALDANQVANFGLMTPQHMVEHMTWVIKSSVKRHGEPGADEPSKRQLGFKKFIQGGAVLQHRPSDKTAADLPALKFASLDEALVQLPIAVERFYNHYEANPDFVSYSKGIGELNFEELELFHYMHARYHLWQFGLIEVYP